MLSMRFYIQILPVFLISAMCKSPSIDHFRNQFPEIHFQAGDTIHFGPDNYRRDLWNADDVRFMDVVLQNGTSCSPALLAEDGGFIEPRYKLMIGGRESFIIHTGDTESVWTYKGRETKLYMRNPTTDKLEPKYSLSEGNAGEGPWFEADSWLLDVDRDGDMDILTREIGQFYAHDDYQSIDSLYAVTWNDTGFVKLNLPNPDSLRSIYRNYYNDYD